MREALKDFWTLLRPALSEPLPDYTENFDQAVLSSDRRARNAGYLVVFAMIFGFGGWATFAPLESAAIGVGTVQVQGDRQPIQHFEGGMVAEIMVANGDYVVAGQPLLRIDPTQLDAELSIVRGQLWAKRATTDRLISERDGQAGVSFSEVLRSVRDERAQIAMASEQALFDARRADWLGEVAVFEQKIIQLQEQIEGSQAVIEAKGRVAGSLSTEVSELNELLADGYVDKQRIRELERSLAQTLGEVADLNARIASAYVAIEEAQLSILQLKKRFITKVVDRLSVVQEEFFDLEHRYAAVADRVSRATVRSPTSGFVMALSPNSIGAVIGSGELLMEVVPDVDELVIDVQMSPLDIDRIRIGQEAEVRFSVFKDSYSVTGELIKISADTMVNEATGQSYYKGTVDLIDEDLGLLGDNKLVPGMPASVLVKTGSRTFLDYLTSPLQRMFEGSLTED